jgi:DNA repair exonuclease SbcCD nuclease subunit
VKIGIISDTHFGARKGSKLFHDYFEEFYKNIFFPTLDEQGIDTVVHMGDAFDSRKGIEFKSLDWAKRVVFNPLKQRGIQVHLMVGNHDAYYKNTNEINAINLLLKEYDNVKVYSSATEVELGNLKTLFIPWINEQNQNQTEKLIQKTSCKCAMGHLELQGFRINKQITMDHGMESKLFDKFTKVFSGHYHTRSDNGKIFYLGNPYEIYWTDVNDLRGFTIFDTETLEHYPVNNPYRIFYNIYYEDQDYQIFDTSEYKNKIVKLIVRKKSDIKKFEKFIDKLYSSGIADLKVVENFDFSSLTEEQSEVFESEDTLSILDRYIQEADTELDKSNIQSIIREIYQEACELG